MSSSPTTHNQPSLFERRHLVFMLTFLLKGCLLYHQKSQILKKFFLIKLFKPNLLLEKQIIDLILYLFDDLSDI